MPDNLWIPFAEKGRSDTLFFSTMEIHYLMRLDLFTESGFWRPQENK